MRSVGLVVSTVNVNGIRAAARKQDEKDRRIDLHVATPRLAATARSAVVERAATHGGRWSDHAPVTVVYGREPAAEREPA